jgi:hypothetical protein
VVSANELTLSVPLNGGLRHILTRRILTLSGAIGITRQVVVTTDASGAPYVCLEAPSTNAVMLNNLHVASAAHETNVASLSRGTLNLSNEHRFLVPLLTDDLLAPLARLPLSYVPESLGLRGPCKVQRSQSQQSRSTPPTTPSATDPMLSLAAAGVSVVRSKRLDALLVGCALQRSAASASTPAVMYPLDTRHNAALTLTAVGMSRILQQLAPSGVLSGTLHLHGPGSAGREARWHWESLTLEFHSTRTSLSGRFALDGQSTEVAVALACAVDRQGRLSVSPRASTADTLTTVAIAGSWRIILQRLLSARPPNGTSTAWMDAGPRASLVQRFVVPGTRIAVEAPASRLLLREGTLSVLYTVPISHDKFRSHAPEEALEIAVRQVGTEPIQVSPGKEVRAEMQAEATSTPSILRPASPSTSQPPAPAWRSSSEASSLYDYVWRTDLPTERSLHQRGNTLVVAATPDEHGTRGGRHVLTTVDLTVIDLFGRAAHARAPVWYRRSIERPKPHNLLTKSLVRVHELLTHTRSG